MVDPAELDKLGRWDVVCEIPAVLDGYERIADAVHDKGWYPNSRKHGSDVDVPVDSEQRESSSGAECQPLKPSPPVRKRGISDEARSPQVREHA